MPRSLLHTNECLLSGDHLSSMDDRFHAVLTGNGELQILWGPLDNGSVIWNCNAGQLPGDYALQMQEDGRLCISRAQGGKPTGSPLWCSDAPSCQSDYYANMQTDGNFVAYRGTGPDHKSYFVWATGCTVRLASENVGVWSAVSTLGSKTTMMLSSLAPTPLAAGVPTNAVSLRTINSSDLAQRWQRWERYQYGNLIGYALISRKTGHYLCGSGHRGTLVITTDLRWNQIWWRKGESGGANDYALVPVDNDGLVLNVFGDGPYVEGNKVGLWDWSGSWVANINSCWQIQG